ncbi:MAG: hypothetical protein JKY22_01910, partial [Flavobacteriaceae bacterium]|nr:hypothetical protein [Flavobacteriaceae bacterium]
MRNSFFIFFGIICCFASISAQEINQNDTAGERHGVWEKYFPSSKQLRYKGEFNHGVEVGTFKFYCSDCGSQPTIVKEFSSKTGNADVKYYTKTGKLVSEGQMYGKDRIGEWLYYHKKANTI